MARRVNRREKIAVALAAAVIFAIALAEWVVLPMAGRRDRLRRQVAAKTVSLEQIQDLATGYGKVRASADRRRGQMQKREKGFTLFSYLDRLAGKADVKNRIAYMRPSTVSNDQQGRQIDRVEMKIQGAGLDHLVRFIHGIEVGDDMIWIRRLTLSKSGKDKMGLNAVFQVETWARKTGGLTPAPSGATKGKA